MKNQFDYINNYYSLNVRRGSKLLFQGIPCTVTSTYGPHLVIKPDDNPKVRWKIHPTWETVYLEKGDIS